MGYPWRAPYSKVAPALEDGKDRGGADWWGEIQDPTEMMAQATLGNDLLVCQPRSAMAPQRRRRRRSIRSLKGLELDSRC